MNTILKGKFDVCFLGYFLDDSYLKPVSDRSVKEKKHCTVTFEQTFHKCEQKDDPPDGCITVSPMPDTSAAPSLAPVIQLAEDPDLKNLADSASKPI